MPREITVLAPRPVTDRDVLEAAVAVDDTLLPIATRQGAMLQLLLPDGELALTVQQPSLLRAPDEIGRLLPGVEVSAAVQEAALRAVTDPAAGPVWIEALAPWTPAGLTGVRICQALADAVGGTCVAQEGR